MDEVQQMEVVAAVSGLGLLGMAWVLQAVYTLRRKEKHDRTKSGQPGKNRPKQ